MTSPVTRVGVISDTHGLLHPEATVALTGADCILHAGDVGDAAILDALSQIAPLTAIRGNIDSAGRCGELPIAEYVTVRGHNLYMLHSVETLDLNPGSAGISAVIFGHSHKPSIEYRRGVLFFNPGAAGPRRFSLPISMGFLEVTEFAIKPALLTLL